MTIKVYCLYWNQSEFYYHLDGISAWPRHIHSSEIPLPFDGFFFRLAQGFV